MKLNCRFSEIFVLSDTSLKSNGVYKLLSDEVVGPFIRWAIIDQPRADRNVVNDLDPGVVKTLCPPYSRRHLIITNARFVTGLDHQLLNEIIAQSSAHAHIITIDPALSRDHEKIRLTESGLVAGIRRLYRPNMHIAPLPGEWPHHVLLSSHALAQLNYSISSNWSDFCRSLETVKATSIAVGSSLADLAKDDQLASFLLSRVSDTIRPAQGQTCRCLGNVIIGNNVKFCNNVLITGPAIIGSNSFIGSDAIIANSIIEPAARVAEKEVLHNQFRRRSKTVGISQHCFADSAGPFRNFGPLAYPGFFKRSADILIAASVLILFAPVILVVSAIVKLTSKGPAFFGDIRQGRHGINFFCYKFRSMIPGADRLQQKLRSFNEVDGPQFKMEDDPRVTSIGRFLRNTYLDELPQFWNVLFGRMSIVGPRPSPEAENSQCPLWRDARLSVRPGITGLWQVSRTRQPGIDFQEWVHYDKLYVSSISPGLDLWICWQTALYILKAFLKQF